MFQFSSISLMDSEKRTKFEAQQTNKLPRIRKWITEREIGDWRLNATTLPEKYRPEDDTNVYLDYFSKG